MNEATLRTLVQEIYNSDLTTLDKFGHLKTENMSYWGRQKFDLEKQEFESVINEFQLAYEKSDRNLNNFLSPHSFRDDVNFGLAAKYLLLWNVLISSLLEDGTFFSIAHALESKDDLSCSTTLASRFYYKQAVQVLRSYIEDLVIPIHFFDNPNDFENWKSNKYLTPSLRGKDGLLRKLVLKGAISQNLSDDVSSLYGKLNGFIHGSEKHLINRDVIFNKGEGHSFSIERFHEWCGYVSSSIEIGIKLLKINIDQWDEFRLRRKLICIICHNQKNFNCDKFQFGNQKFSKYSCPDCKHAITFNSKWETTHEVRIFKPDSGDSIHPEGIPESENNQVSFDSIDSFITKLFYILVSNAEDDFKMDELSAFFLPSAKIFIPRNSNGVAIVDLRRFVKYCTELFLNTKETGSEIVETSRKIEEFVNITQVWSVFENRNSSDRNFNGTIGFQILKGESDFWIVSILFETSS